MNLIGQSDLGGEGLSGEVAVVGNTAIVAAGYMPLGFISQSNTTLASLNSDPPCPPVSVKVVDLSDPTRPEVAATIPVPDGQVARDVDALHIETASFTGDLAAVAFATCQYDEEIFGATGQAVLGSYAHRGVGYYDVTNPAQPELLGRYFADFDNIDPDAPPCGPPPDGGDGRCAQDQFSVQLKGFPDGRIMSLSTRPSPRSPSQDLRLVDITDPRNPTQVGSWPVLDEGPPRGSNNGCSPRGATRSAEFSSDGTKILTPYFDGGLFVLDAGSDTNPPTELGQWSYPDDWNVEGNAAYATSAEVDGRELALLSEEDWVGTSSAFRVDSPAAVAGVQLGCAAFYTTFDQSYQAQVGRHPGREVPGELTYIGPGCPAQNFPPPREPKLIDPFTSDPRGKIALASAGGCSIPARARRIQDAGALGIVSYRANLIPEAQSFFPTPGMPSEPTDGRGAPVGEVVIPETTIKQPAGDALRGVLCPSIDPATNQCTGGEQVFGAMVDLPGEWGGLRVIDVSDATTPTEVATYRTANAQIFPPPDHRGIYSVHHALVQDERAYVAWNSDGLRVLDLSAGGVPTEIASFVPPDTPDPTGTVPAKAYVTGVATTARHVVITDINSGLYVLEVVNDPCVGVSSAGFTDIPAANVHREAIDCMVSLGIALGTSPTMYQPASNVRRDQMASFIARMIDHVDPDALPDASGVAFSCASDPAQALTASNVHLNNIQRLAAAEVVLGGPGGLPADCYGAEQPVQRDQMASFINRAIGVLTGELLASDQDLFTDDEASVHEANINAIAAERIVLGTGDGLYDPFSSVRRDQMGSFIVRALRDLSAGL